MTTITTKRPPEEGSAPIRHRASSDVVQPMRTTAHYFIPAMQATSVDAPAMTELLSDPFFHAADLINTQPSIDIGRVTGGAIAEAMQASAANLVAAMRPSFSLQLYLPRLPEPPQPLRETFALLKHSSVTLDLVDVVAPLVVEDRLPRAFRAFKEIGEWLGASDEQLAETIGIGRTTVYSWARDGREPRRRTARRIYEFHSVLGSVRRHLGEEDFVRWLAAGEPQRRDLLLAGQLDAIEPEVDAVLFDRRGPRPDLRWGEEDAGSIEPEPGATAPRPSMRKARRARLP